MRKELNLDDLNLDSMIGLGGDSAGLAALDLDGDSDDEGETRAGAGADGKGAKVRHGVGNSDCVS